MKFLGISIVLILIFVAPVEYQAMQYFDAIQAVLDNAINVIEGLK